MQNNFRLNENEWFTIHIYNVHIFAIHIYTHTYSILAFLAISADGKSLGTRVEK